MLHRSFISFFPKEGLTKVVVRAINTLQMNDERVSLQNSHTRSSRDDLRVSLTTEGLCDDTTKLVYVHSFGCNHNMSDGEYMKGLLSQGNYCITSTKEKADIWVINTCTVRDKSIQSFLNLYNEAKNRKKVVVIAGCMTTADANMSKTYKDDIIVGVKEFHRIREILDARLKGNSYRSDSTFALPPLDLPKIRKDDSVEIIPISVGCLGSCTFCQTRLARGVLQSYSRESILERVQASIQEGRREIWLTSEDTGAYGIDRQDSLMHLLSAIRPIVEPTNVMVKIGMTNPPFLLPVLPQLAQLMLHKNFYSYLHIPVQSGSDSVLKRMNRKYTVRDFETITSYLTSHCHGITVSTDIIVAFPFETEEDHAMSMRLLKNLDLSIVHYSRYYARPHTIAAKYKQIEAAIAKKRVKELSDWFKALDPYSSRVGEYTVVWVSNEKSNGKRCCHTKEYIKVLVEDEPSLQVGDILIAKCVGATRFHVDAVVVDRIATLPTHSLHPTQLRAKSVDALHLVLQAL